MRRPSAPAWDRRGCGQTYSWRAPMMAHEFKLMQRILKERSGIEIGEGKMDLVEAKLRPLLKELGFPSQAHLTLALMKRESDGLRSRVAQTIAVLESYFFRDKTPFQYFADVMLPRLMERRAAQRRIRIWCAASSVRQKHGQRIGLLAGRRRRTPDPDPALRRPPLHEAGQHDVGEVLKRCLIAEEIRLKYRDGLRH